MSTEYQEWLKDLNKEDLQFIKRFILASGSLKTLAKEYGVSYPTLRIRLDRLIEKVKVCDDQSMDDPFKKQIRLMVADGEISDKTAIHLLQAHEKSKKERN